MMNPVIHNLKINTDTIKNNSGSSNIKYNYDYRKRNNSAQKQKNVIIFF
jgi:hypothetical protein